MFSFKKKVLFGLSVSLVLAMAIGSFALSETQTPANTQLETQSVAASNDDTGNFAVNGEGGTVSFVDPLLTIDGGSYTISMEEGVTSNSQRIELKGGATVILDGVTVDDTTDGPAITISGSQDVTILLADGSKNVLKGKVGSSSTDPGDPGIQKTDSASGWLIIGIPENSEGTGELEATGGYYAAGIGGGIGGGGSAITISGGKVTANGGGGAAGIGGGGVGNGSDITISGGVVTATGGANAAGIGGGYRKNGSNITIKGGTVIATGGVRAAGIGGGDSENGSAITISGGVVTATGGAYGAGIGGGTQASGSDIKISGGTVTATGGDYAAGIGGGLGGSGSNNSITGDNVVVIAESGDASKAALDGFSSIDKGLIFRNGQETSGNWSGNMNNNITLSESLKIPSDLTIPEGKTLLINEGKTLTVPDGSVLTNDGTMTINGTVSCTGTGKVTTKTDFYRNGSTTVYETGYQTYQTSEGVQKYKDLPNPDDTTLLKNSLNSDKFIYWYYLNGSTEVKIDNSKDVEPNQHKFYEKREEAYSISTSKHGEGTITPNVTEAYKGDEVTFTATPKEGYELKEGSVKVTDKDGNEIQVTEKDGKYTFKMPDSEVKIIATFEGKSHEITIDQPEHGTVTIDPESPRTGDEVTITLKPEEGYKPGGTPVVKDEDGNEIELTPTGNPNEYKFTMPNSDLTVDVNFVPDSTPTPPGPEPGPEPEPTPEPTPDPSVNPDGDGGSGSGSGSSSKTSDPFMGGIALALLGVATTGAVLVRKRK